MKFYVGQKVRLLHEEGEGEITRILDEYTVEVDIDDFIREFGVTELVVVHGAGPSNLSKSSEDRGTRNDTISMAIQEITLAVIRIDDEYYELHLLNPEKYTLMFSFHMQVVRKYEGIAAGTIAPDSTRLLGKFQKAKVNGTKELFFQFLFFLPGRNHPEEPMKKALPWNKSRLQKKISYIKSLSGNGWLFPLREVEKGKVLYNMNQQGQVVKEVDMQVRTKHTMIIDLHIEELREDWGTMLPAEMFQIQMLEFERVLNEAIIENYTKLILIHGIGKGKLKREIHRKLSFNSYVKEFKLADPIRYGNGATEVTFKS